MNVEEAILKSIRTYWEKAKDYDDLQSSKDRKYNKKYFDSVEEEFLTKKETSDKVVKAELGVKK